MTTTTTDPKRHCSPMVTWRRASVSKRTEGARAQGDAVDHEEATGHAGESRRGENGRAHRRDGARARLMHARAVVTM